MNSKRQEVFGAHGLCYESEGLWWFDALEECVHPEWHEGDD